jgi:hypothetical protein
MTTIFFFIGFITGIFFLKIYQSIKKNKTKTKRVAVKFSKYLRRGLYTNSYSTSQNGYKTGDVTVQFEVGELEKTSGMSKVEVINLSTSNDAYNKEGSDRDRMKSMVDNLWLDSSQIEWIEDPIQKMRDEKLNEILN